MSRPAKFAGVIVGLFIVGQSIYLYRNRPICPPRAPAEIAAIATALEVYHSDSGAYPASGIQNVHSALVGGTKTYMPFRPEQLSISGATTNIVDPFGTPYNYRCPGIHNPKSFDFWSNGPDRRSGTRDDVTNWKR